MGSEFDDNFQSLTVTVALELDEERYGFGNAEAGPSDAGNDKEHELKNDINDLKAEIDDAGAPLRFNLPDLNIKPRLRPNDVCPQVDANLSVSDLTPELVHLLELRLNPVAVGTLKNWEFLCAHLGASMDEITNYRRFSSPTAHMFRIFANISLKRFLEIICLMNRVDVLISIGKKIEALKYDTKRNVNAIKSTKNAVAQYSGEETALVTRNSTTSNSRFDTKQAFNNIFTHLNNPFIFVLHHEINKESKACFKYLIHNLRRYCSQNLQILDVEDCVDELNVYDTGQLFYQRAKEVLVVFSPDYIHSIVEYNDSSTTEINSMNSKIRLKYYLHNLTNSEYIQNGMRNTRFRAVIMNGTNRSQIPNSWATNTIQYFFPDNFPELCKRLFSEEAINKTVS